MTPIGYSILACVATSTMSTLLKIADKEKGAIDVVLERVASVLKSGGVVALPTDTLYGIAACINSDDGIKRLYSIKGRAANKPIAICVNEVHEISRWAMCDHCSDVLTDLLPGKVTTVLKRKKVLNPKLNPDTLLVGVRIPDHQFVREVVRRCGQPIALTSANVSNSRSTLDVEEFRDLWAQLDLVIDGGQIVEDGCPDSRLGSTVVNLAEDGKFSIIRAGSTHDEVVRLLKEKYQLTEMYQT